eukprot:CAMPEP_0114604688 /NCGR_PEP_ID=MMETSP0168-20121206/674_1 /TAXON_ID=95228 ORGANISM="Vannella sp., Strain DIVA3 517/6/12" /NCGR_SAMPLE_ID=MMETSP0168 /ASSEMBLY_ACC=CAM_ASM_000044 /LENGTH=81 /DNA_ID=CAMNT_0001815527 /DNA_START=39 /DNA_END=284 /DNA_ORIENTATION=+
MSEELTTAAYDPRFPNTNQTKHCWLNYVKYHRCAFENDEDSELCAEFRRNYNALCPQAWTEAWDEQRDDRIFPGLPREMQG